MLALCDEYDLASINRIPLAMGQVLTRDGRSYVQAALGWIWARSPRTVPVPGFRTVEQVEEDAAALRLGPLSEEQMQEIRRLKLD